MEPHVLAYDANGNIILNLKERLTRIEGRMYVYDIPNRRQQITVNGLQPGQHVWAAAMGQYLVAEVRGNIITYYFAVSQDEYNINRQFKGLTYEGWLAYGIY